MNGSLRRKTVWMLLSLALLAGPAAWADGRISEVTVTVTGPEERLVVQEPWIPEYSITYAASVSYSYDGTPVQESAPPPAGCKLEYNWSWAGGQLEDGGKAEDSFVTLHFTALHRDDASAMVTAVVTAGSDSGSAAGSCITYVPKWTSGEGFTRLIESWPFLVGVEDGDLFLTDEEVFVLSNLGDRDERRAKLTTYPGGGLEYEWRVTAGSFMNGCSTGPSAVWLTDTPHNSIAVEVTCSDGGQVIPIGETGIRTESARTDIVCQVVVIEVDLTDATPIYAAWRDPNDESANPTPVPVVYSLLPEGRTGHCLLRVMRDDEVVRSLVDADQEGQTAARTVDWDVCNDAGIPLAPGRYMLSLDWTVTAPNGKYSKTALAERDITVVRPDIRIDSDNDGGISDADDPIEDRDSRVGALVTLNDDDDNHNGAPDWDDPGFPGDDEVKEVQLRIEPEGVAGGLTAELELFAEAGQARVWTDAARSQAITEWPYLIPLDRFPLSVFVEGTDWQRDVAKLRLRVRDAGAFQADDQARFYPGTLGIGIAPQVRTDERPMMVMTGLPDGQPVELTVYCNGLAISEMTRASDGLAVAEEIDTSASQGSPGDLYWVVASADGGALVLTSPTCLIIPGLPAAIAFALSKSELVADGHDSLVVNACVVDAFGNPVEDGTPVHLLVGRALGGGDTVQISETANGQVSFEVTAPDARGIEATLAAGAVHQPVIIPVAPVFVSLAAADTVLDIHTGQTTSVTLTTNASDGTPVFWVLGNPGSGQPGTVTTFVSGGTSTLSVSSAGARIGPAGVTAVVAEGKAATTLTYVSSAPLTVTVARPYLVGSITADRVCTVTETIPRPPAYQPGPDLTLTHTVYEFAETTVVVQGLPTTTYSVSLDDPADATLCLLLGLVPTGVGAGELTTDATGRAEFTICSTGAFAGTFSGSDYFHEVVFTVSGSTGEVAGGGETMSSSTADEQTVKSRIVLEAEAAWHATLCFFGADPTNAAEGLNSFAGGVLGVGDAGALIKNVFRALGGSSTPVNQTEVLLSGVGLMTTLSGLVAADVPIAAARTACAYGRSWEFAELLAQVTRRMLMSGVSDSGKALAFVSEALGNKAFAEACESVCRSEVSLASAMRNFDTYGKTFADAIAEVHSAGQVQAGSLRSAIALLDALPAGVKTAIRDGPRVKEAMKAVAAVLDRGVDAGLLRNVLKNDLYAGAIPAIGEATAYTRADLLEDLAKVASAPSVQGLDRLVTSLSWGSSGRFGYRYELEVAAWLVREKGAQSLQFVQKQVWDGGELVTDIDIIADNVYYQCKRSGDAFKRGAEGITKWVVGAKRGGASRVVYVTPNSDAIPRAARDQILRCARTKGLNIPASIEPVPFG